ncbi:unnamed protein product [Ascophyllum nodosum]
MFPSVGGQILGSCRFYGATLFAASRSAPKEAMNRALLNYRWPFSACWTRGHKTVSSVKKRVRLTGSGNLKRGQTGRRHNTGPKPRSRMRRLMQTRLIEGTQKKKILWMLGCG